MKFWRQRKDEELDAEIRSHLDEAIRDRIARGESAEQARAHALREFGNVGLVKEVTRAMWGWGSLERLMQDVRFAGRSLRKHALLSFIVGITLTLGIGVSAGIFAFYNAEFLRAKLDRDFASFARVYASYTNDPLRPGRPGAATLEDYLAVRDRAKTLREVAAYAEFSASFDQRNPRTVRALLTTCNFLAVYGLQSPLLGRTLQLEDCDAAQPVVVLSERLWREQFAADPQIVGKTVHFNSQPVTVVGVTPIFAGLVNGAQAWFPYTLETYLKHGDDLQRPGEAAWLNLAGRLAPGFSHRDAAVEFNLIASQQDRLHPGRTTTLTVTDGSWIQDPDSPEIKWVFSVIVAALVFFVLIVCLNVATLLLARAAARRQEVTVRLALGASRMRLVRMLLTETLLLAALAGLAGAYLAYRLPHALNAWLLSEGGATDYSLAPDWRVFVYLTLVTVLTGVVAGLTPALQSLKVNLSETLNGRPNAPGGVRGSRLYGLLIGAQVALSFFMLYGAGLFVSVARQAAALEPGFETRQVLEAGLYVQRRGLESRNWEALQRTLTERITALPGVQSVAYSYSYPFSGTRLLPFQLADQSLHSADNAQVSPNYFTTLGIPIVSGRALRQDDLACDKAANRSSCAAVVSQRLAREFWPQANPLGQTLRAPNGDTFEVVGVARDLSSTRLGGLDAPMIYQPLNLNATYPPHPFVRFAGESATLAHAVTVIARAAAPELIVKAQTLETKRAELLHSLRRPVQLIVALCALALLLAVIGIYGVVAFAISQRTKEIGIRLALGAQKQDIYRAVLGTSGRPVVIGLLLGLGITFATWFAVAPLLRETQFNLNAQAPLNYAVTAVLLTTIALAAMLIPARRATKVDPLTTLRHE